MFIIIWKFLHEHACLLFSLCEIIDVCIHTYTYTYTYIISIDFILESYTSVLSFTLSLNLPKYFIGHNPRLALIIVVLNLNWLFVLYVLHKSSFTSIQLFILNLDGQQVNSCFCYFLDCLFWGSSECICCWLFLLSRC